MQRFNCKNYSIKAYTTAWMKFTTKFVFKKY